ncbi:ABC transporter substrate-binding protein [Mycobacterium sp. GA-2829]|uniref:ABC transporter substrate-binding protein n=1 Tax=Mycobacterium sp. GA-2829 TaxID=1772283 RepID=UPI0009E6AACC|nr:ABC transporter substrate-binding protein [Mycobacterium sp. GA-2829]
MNERGPGPLGRNFSRRDLLKYTSMGLAGAALLGSTAACGSADLSGGQAPAGPPKRGGTLTLGGSGGAASDTLDPHIGTTNCDYARLPLLYDPLVGLDHEGKVKYVLAESIIADETGKSYVITLRKGVVAHDGQPFTADDVLFNFKRIVDGNLQGATTIGPIDFAATRVLDARRLQLVFQQPFSILVETLAGLPFYFMAARSWREDNVVGTGPFRFQDFQPGAQSTFVRNEHYWDEGKPHLDAVTVLNMSDEITQVNALLSGQVDAINYLSAQAVPQLQAAGMVLTISQTGGWAPITLPTNTAPFDDVRVRQAFRLLVDREQINDVVYGGYGTVANDVFAPYDPASTTFPQRERNLDEARSLLKSAGHDRLSLTMITNDVVPAQRSVAQLLAQQTKEAGVDISVQFENATTFFANSYLKTTNMAQDYWYYVPYLANAAGATVPGAPFNATFFNDAEYGRLYESAVTTSDAGRQAEYVHQMQQIDYDRGGNVIPVFYPIIDATSSQVGGLAKDVSGWPLGNWNFKELWVER